MAPQAGIDFLLKVEDSGTPGTYLTIGGLRSKSLSFNNEAIDVTSHDSSEWKELLDGKGIKSMSVSGSGVFTNSSAETQIRNDLIAGTLRKFKLFDGAGNTFEAIFKITSLEYGGEYNAEQNWSISLESSGAVSIA